jgi:beta-mannosidase
MRKTGLDGSWTLYYFKQGEFEIHSLDDLKNDHISSVPAEVPGNVELDLSRNGVLPQNLFFGANILLLKEYEYYEWW